MALVFSSKCRPQQCDAVDVAINNNILFFGYPLLKKGVAYDPQNLCSCLVDPALPETEWKKQSPNEKAKRQQVTGHNLVQDVLKCLQNKEDVLGIVPRPDRGVMYIGRVTDFKLIGNPPWGTDYLNIRKKLGMNIDDMEKQHIADVAQCFVVEPSFVEIPYHQIPSWIIASAMGRATLGRVKKKNNGISAYSVLAQLMDKKDVYPTSYTRDIKEIETRLANWCSPNVFEHLCVHLLQLEHPTMTWRHIGGSGDGGVDGIGGSTNSKTKVLQCKLFGLDLPRFFNRSSEIPHLYLATMDEVINKNLNNTTVWDKSDIAKLIVKHASLLPIARTLLIGKAT